MNGLCYMEADSCCIVEYMQTPVLECSAGTEEIIPGPRHRRSTPLDWHVRLHHRLANDPALLDPAQIFQQFFCPNVTFSKYFEPGFIGNSFSSYNVLIKVNVMLKIVLAVLLTHGQAYLSFHPLSILAPQIALHRQIFNENPDQLCIILKL